MLNIAVEKVYVLENGSSPSPEDIVQHALCTDGVVPLEMTDFTLVCMYLGLDPYAIKRQLMLTLGPENPGSRIPINQYIALYIESEQYAHPPHHEEIVTTDKHGEIMVVFTHLQSDSKRFQMEAFSLAEMG